MRRCGCLEQFLELVKPSGLLASELVEEVQRLVPRA
jgi:hypothetical protein